MTTPGRAFLFAIAIFPVSLLSAFAGDVPDSVAIVTSKDPPPSKADIAFHDVYQLNSAMLDDFATALDVTQKNLRDRFPLIMGLFSESGGRFILYRPGQPPLEAPPVPGIYRLAKAVAHSTLGLYELVAPTLNDSGTDWSWIAPMQTFRTQLLTARDALPDLDIKPGERALLQLPLDKDIAFVDACLAKKSYTYDDVVAFARSVEPDAEKLIGLAAGTQVTHWFDVLADWKKLLGADWDQTYALTNSLFPTRQNNILFTIMVQFMGEDAINRRLFMFETTDFQTTPDEMFSLYARYINDRGLSKVFFNYEYLMSHELLNGGARKVIESETKARGMKTLLPPLAPLNSTQWPWLTDPDKGSGPRSLDDLHESGYLPPLPK